MKPRGYFRQFQDAALAATHVLQSNLAFDEISESECYIRGSLTLIGGFQLHVAEYVVTEQEIQRLKYRYHLQTMQNDLVCRWDNAPHHPEVETHPHHLHLAQGAVESSPAMNIEQVLVAILPFLIQNE